MKRVCEGRVLVMMKNFALLVVLVACGPKQTTPVSNDPDPPGPVKDTRTEYERRRDTACETLGPKLTACAVEDAKKDLAAGRVKQQEFEQNTSQDVQRKNTEEFIKTCKQQQYSSRQIRVLEVCQQEESECEPMLSCLEHLNQQEGK